MRLTGGTHAATDGDATIVERLRRHARERPDTGAFAFVRDRGGPRRELSYAALDRLSDAVAAWLTRHDLRGRPVALPLSPSLDFIVTLIGCLKAGAVAVPLPAPRTPAEQARFAAVATAVSPAAVVVDDAGNRERLAGLVPPGVLIVEAATLQETETGPTGSVATPDGLAYLQFTSGSTGQPKGVRILHRNIVDNSELTRVAFGTDQASRGVGWLPMFHDMGLIGNVMHPLWVGFGAVLMTPSAFLRRPRFWLETISRERATISGAPPSALRYCADRETGRGEPLDLSSWAVAFVGAERIDRAALDMFVDAYAASGFARTSLFPCYGLAEATLFVTGGPRGVAPRMAAAPDGEGPCRAPLVGCGRVDRARVAIVDDRTGAAAADDVVGAVWVTGGSVADGYHRRDEDDGFGRHMAGSAEAWLDTGDLGFVRGGELFVTGRRKELVVVGGANYYPHDIEQAASAAVAEIDPAGCAAFAVPNGATEGAVLVAEWRRQAAPADASSVRVRIAAAVAAATGLSLLAVDLVRPGSLPRTTSGKIERLALRTRYRARAATGIEGAPASLREAVALVTGIAPPDVDLSLPASAAGLDSLGIYRLLALASDHLDLDGNVEALFAGLPLGDAFAASTPPGPRADAAAERPLTDGELGLWIGQQAHPDSAVYTLVAAAIVSPQPDPDRLRAAFRAVRARHPILGMRIDEAAGEPTWSPATVSGDGFVVEAHACESDLDDRLASLAATAIDPRSGPLVRLHLLRAAGKTVVAVVAHHLAVDAAALQRIVIDLERAYRGALPASERPRAAPSAIRSSAHDRTPRGAQTQAPGWPHPDPAAPALAVTRRRTALDAGAAAIATATARAAGASGAALALAAFALSLARWSGERRLTVATPLAGRGGAQAQAVGFHAQTVTIAFDLDRHATGRDLVAWTGEALRDAAARQLAPMEQRSAAAAACLFTVHRPEPLLAPLVAGTGSAQLGSWRVTAMDVAPAERLEDLALALTDTGEGWVVALDARRDRIGETAAERMLHHWRALVMRLGQAPDRALGEIDRLDPEDRSRITVPAPQPPAAPAGWLRAILEGDNGTRPAIRWSEGIVTYSDLRREVAGFREALAGAALPAGSRVAVLMPRTPRLVAALLAVLAEEHAYVPLDPAYPAARLDEMLAASAAAALVVADASAAAALGASRPVTIEADAAPACVAAARAPVPVMSEALAAVLFTSGSTGRPKGVMLRHGAVAAMIGWARATFPADAWTASAGVTSVCFDLSLFELFTPLACGGVLCLFDDALALVSDRGRAADLRLLNTVPSAARALVEHGALPPGLTTLNLAGEPLTGGLAADIRRALPHVALWNLYGPTEDTTYSTAARITAKEAEEPGIGVPLPGTEALLLDGRGRDVPRGAAGELYLAGAGLARGYLDAPALTAERFLPHPSETGARVYRTGDLARLRPDGSLGLLGRRDHQVKLRGYRIELDEVAAALRRLPGIRAACVLHAPATDAGPAALVGFVEAAPDLPGATDLRAALGRLVPFHMVPAAIVRLDRLPLGPNGKVDRGHLATLAWRTDGEDVAAPLSATEAEVAACWAAALGHADFGADDHFLAVGGDSLSTMAVLRLVNGRFDVSIDLATAVRHDTVRALAAHIDRVQLVRGAPVDGAAELIEL